MPESKPAPLAQITVSQDLVDRFLKESLGERYPLYLEFSDVLKENVRGHAEILLMQIATMQHVITTHLFAEIGLFMIKEEMLKNAT